VTAVPARVGVLHAEQLEILFPIRSLLRERRIAKAGLNPYHDPVFVHPRMLHVVQIFVACD
jgi:hypothetical protein